jgi:hypothetical protein
MRMRDGRCKGNDEELHGLDSQIEGEDAGEAFAPAASEIVESRGEGKTVDEAEESSDGSFFAGEDGA